MPVERRGPAVRNSFTDQGGGGEMIKAPINPQDLGRGIYAKGKADPGGPGGVGGGGGAAAPSAAAAVGRISLGAKRAGERCTGNPSAPFDVAGAGDVARGAGLRPTAKAVDEPPDPTVRAPALDPTDVAGVGDGLTAGLVRHSQRKRGATARPGLRGTAPALDPT